VQGGHNFYALLEFDVPDLRHHLRSLRADGSGGSLYSFFLKAIGKVIEFEPLFNTFIDYLKTEAGLSDRGQWSECSDCFQDGA